MKYFLLYLSFFFLTPTINFAQDYSLERLVDLVARQTILSQQITKCFIASGAEINRSKADLERDICISEFEEIIIELNEIKFDGKIKEELEKTEKIWEKYRIIAASSPERIDGAFLIIEGDKLFAQSKKLLDYLLSIEGNKNSILSNVYMCSSLSQRATMLYLAYFWGFGKGNDINLNIEKAYKKTLASYKNEFSELEDKANTVMLKDNISNLSFYWYFPNKKIKRIKRNIMKEELIYIGSLKLLKEYEYLAKSI